MSTDNFSLMVLVQAPVHLAGVHLVDLAAVAADFPLTLDKCLIFTQFLYKIIHGIN